MEKNMVVTTTKNNGTRQNRGPDLPDSTRRSFLIMNIKHQCTQDTAELQEVRHQKNQD
jgi:hypothetical protein